ncbi:phosphate butyryltransferase [Bacillus carboniphilus]|uniref:Phosphate butyryltransferase n=1 Tax=Bacillus carboniphilus TaxID=86663 RepID=A0ABY9JY12_9BACI|nr:phosphate butyryltransferase [Bacillus carboniphilus]WLR44277.1 phosphate butyryltransferase [Bacillus carboniphilus]
MELNELFQKAERISNATIAVAVAEDHEVIKAIQAALDKKLAHFILFGKKEPILSLLDEYGINLDLVSVQHADTKELAAKLAVQAVHNQEANILMKGNVSTAILLKEVLNKEYGLRTGQIISHVAAFQVPNYKRLLFLSDAAMNISPSLEEKKQIIENAVDVAHSLGIEEPKVAPICAVETVNPSMQATTDASMLSVMNSRGQIKGCLIDGPLALDNAISIQAAEHKGIKSEVAGLTDILTVPNIETGNVLYKSLVYFANAKVGAVIMGAKAPIILTSRADSAESKLYSIALGVCTSQKNRLWGNES